METFSSLLILLARSTGKGFQHLPRLLGGLPHSVKSPLLTWLERLSPNHRSHSPASSIFYRVNKGNSYHHDWLILWRSCKDARGIMSAAVQTSQTLPVPSVLGCSYPVILVLGLSFNSKCWSFHTVQRFWSLCNLSLQTRMVLEKSIYDLNEERTKQSRDKELHCNKYPKDSIMCLKCFK